MATERDVHSTCTWLVSHELKYYESDYCIIITTLCLIYINAFSFFICIPFQDKEPPKVENCENNELFLNGSESAGANESNWDEPVFYDNSGLAVKVNRTIHTTNERRHSVFYTAGDKFDNIAKCLVNLTIQGRKRLEFSILFAYWIVYFMNVVFFL